MKQKLSFLAMLFATLILMSSTQYHNKKDGSKSDSSETVTGKDTLDSKQLLIIITEGWNEVKGKLYCYEKNGHSWQFVFSNPVVVGIKGMGLGVGIKSFDLPNAPLKKEGDLKAPAGIFRIGTAFGYAKRKEVAWLHVSYMEATNELLCIDDGHSSSYNKLVYSGKTKQDWNSREEMHRKDDMYKWGLFVEHNSTEPKQGRGSCIFLHIWKNNNKGTAGCSAMQEDDILRLLKWVDASKKPLLVQFPRKEYENISEQIDLPRP